MKFNNFLSAIIIFSSLISFESIADEASSKTKELTALQKQIKQISQKINHLNTKKNDLVSELKKLDIQYGNSTILLKRIEKQVKQQQIILKENKQQIDKKQQQINSQKNALERQIKAAYGIGRNEKLKLMLSQKDPILSGRIMLYYDYLNKARLTKIAKIDKDLQQILVLEQERLKETTFLQEKLEIRKQERSVLKRTKSERRAVLTKINAQFASKNQQLNRFKASEKRLKALITSLQHAMNNFPLAKGSVKEFSRLKGSLPWPVRGKLTKKFGAKRSASRWDGVLIGAKEGTKVRVVTRGRVVYADWLRGYGLLTIIDHGKGYMTLYAFSQSLYTAVGDLVEAGAVIATVGQSGGRPGTELYFGIRQKGKPVNPEKWCRKIRR